MKKSRSTKKPDVSESFLETEKVDSNPALVPKLRFPEFVGGEPWKLTSLDDALSPVLRERSKPTVEYVGLGLRSHGKGTFLKPLEDPAKNSMDQLYEIKKNDLIVNITFAWEGAVAIAKECDDGALVSHRFPTYTFEKRVTTPEFFRYIILNKQFVYSLGVISPGGAGRNRVMNKTDFLKLQVGLPSPAEQQKIADCLNSLDELIGEQGRKVDVLRTQKKGLMQQLFPREGETQPQLRFPEFQDAGDWEMHTLGEISAITSGTTPLRSNPEFFTGGTIPWVKTTDLNNSFITKTEESITPKARARINPTGAVLIAMYGGFNQIGRTGCLRVPAATNQALSVLVLNQNCALSAYVLSWLNAKVAVWKRMASSSRKDPNITGSDVSQFPIFLPSLPEQQRIATCLSSLDDLITAETQKLEALKTHKRGLMQQMFPSPEEAS
jgi:type I restriction enzyme S subunit